MAIDVDVGIGVVVLFVVLSVWRAVPIADSLFHIRIEP